MAKETINNLESLGVIRGKVNSNFTELYDADLVNLKESDIGSTVQGFDANTVKKNEANTFSENQSFDSRILVGGATLSASFAAHIKSLGNNLFPLVISSSNGDFMSAFKESSTSGVELDFRNPSGSVTSKIVGVGNTYFNGGNVGIGTTGPVYELDVVGTIRASSSTPTLYLNETDGLAWRLRVNSDKLEFIRSASILGVWTSTGLGIGTTSPTYKLDVSGNARINAGFVSTNGEASFAAGSTFNTGALVNIGSGFSPSKTLLNITGVDNETTEKAIDIYDENGGNMFYLRSDGTSTTGRSEAFVNGSIVLGNATLATAGAIRYNTSTNKHQGYNGTTWNDLY